MGSLKGVWEGRDGSLGSWSERSWADLNPSIWHLKWSWNRECRIKGQIIELYIWPTNFCFACFMVDLEQREIAEAKQYCAVEQYHSITLHETHSGVCFWRTWMLSTDNFLIVLILLTFIAAFTFVLGDRGVLILLSVPLLCSVISGYNKSNPAPYCGPSRRRAKFGTVEKRTHHVHYFKLYFSVLIKYKTATIWKLFFVRLSLPSL